MLSVSDALARVLDGVEPLPREDAPLVESDGRVLAADVAALRTQPPADMSAMDGYAVRAADVAKVPVALKLVGEVAATDLLAEVADSEARVAGSVAAVAGSVVVVAGAAAEDASGAPRQRLSPVAQRRVRARSTRSLHRCPRLNLEVASGPSPTNSSSPWTSVLASPTARSLNSWTASR